MRVDPGAVDRAIDQRGLRRRWLYEQLDWHESDGSKILRGRKDIEPAEARKLADLLGIVVDAIVAAADARPGAGR
jgi:ribosome-binding protein aMBF1 (putative translation factor)